MSDWLARLLGVDTASLPEDAMTEFVWSHAPQSWGVFVLIGLAIALVWGVFYFYRREVDAAPRRAKLGLGGLRAVIVLLLIMVALGPALAVSTLRQIEPFVIVLLDESLSMSLADRYTDEAAAEHVAAALNTDVPALRQATPTRAEVISQAIQKDNAAVLRGLSDKGRLRILSFGRTVRLRDAIGQWAVPDQGTPTDEPVPVNNSQAAVIERGEPLPPLRPTSPSTDMAQAIGESLRLVSGSPLGGIVMFSDGQNTEGEDPLAAAARAGEQAVPIFTVGIGDPAEPRNLKVAEVWAPDSTFRDDPFLLQTQVRAQGMAGSTVNVELLSRRVMSDGTTGPQSTVQTRQVSFTEPASEQRLTFEHKPVEAGDYVFTVRVTAQPGELLETDNQRSAAVKVLSDKARVLLVSGGPSWEYRMLSQLLIRDNTTDVSCWLQTMDLDMRQEGNTVIDSLPRTPAQLFEYDVVMLLDPDPREFDQAWIDTLKTFVSDHAGGLLFMAGPQHTARILTQFRTRSIRDLMPVNVDELTHMDVQLLVATYSRPWPLSITGTGADHAMMRLDDDPQINRRMWQAMPGIFWSFQARSAKPAASVLVEHSDPRLRGRDGNRPLLVAGQYGPGRTVYMGFNGTWRWRKVGEQYFDQFWIQTVRYLIEGRLLGSKKRGRLATDREVYPVGSRVSVSAQLYDAAFEPMTQPTIPATISAPASPAESIELKAVPNRPGHYEASLIATQVGLNELAITLGDGGVVRIVRQFTVEVPRVEFADARLNESMLQDIAAASGGSYFTVNQLHLLPAAIQREPETIVIKGKPIELWDTNRLLILLVVLLTIEWALRKRFRMM